MRGSHRRYPNTGLLAGTGAQLAPNGAVLIGADLATSVPNIYAVGDCAACRDGSLRTSSLKVEDLEIARTGLTETEARKAGLRVKSAMATGTDRPGICPNPTASPSSWCMRPIPVRCWVRRHGEKRMFRPASTPLPLPSALA